MLCDTFGADRYGCQYYADSRVGVYEEWRRIIFNKANEGTAVQNDPNVGNSICPSAAAGWCFTHGSDPICKGRDLPIPPHYYLIDQDTEFAS